jgi:hypothetical protein
MGDRCYEEVVCKRKDKTVFEKLGFVDQGEYLDSAGKSYPELVLLVDEQANYAHSGELGPLARKGIVFSGSHGDGGDYPGCNFASDGKQYAEVITAHGQPVVALDEKGSPDQCAVTRAKRYLAVLRATRKLLGLPPP